MFEFLKRLLSREPTKPTFTPEEHERWDEQKLEGLTRVLGPMDDVVSHAMMPWEVGGYLDLYQFSRALPGTALVTMELVSPDGTGPRSTELGTYELLAFTRRTRGAGDAAELGEFVEETCTLLTTLARYAEDAVLEPGETCSLPTHEGPERHVLLTRVPELDSFRIGTSRHGLLTCIELHPSELEHVREEGPEALVAKLRAAGHFPYSDLDRAPVA